MNQPKKKKDKLILSLFIDEEIKLCSSMQGNKDRAKEISVFIKIHKLQI